MYQCDYCGKSLSNQRGLEMHVAAHKNVKFKCDQCAKVYTAPTNLRRHVREVHERKVDASVNTVWSENDTGYICSVCRATYSRMDYSKYNEHVLTHNE